MNGDNSNIIAAADNSKFIRLIQNDSLFIVGQHRSDFGRASQVHSQGFTMISRPYASPLVISAGLKKPSICHGFQKSRSNVQGIFMNASSGFQSTSGQGQKLSKSQSQNANQSNLTTSRQGKGIIEKFEAEQIKKAFVDVSQNRNSSHEFLNKIGELQKAKRIMQYEQIVKNQLNSRDFQTAINTALLKSDFVDILKSQVDSISTGKSDREKEAKITKEQQNIHESATNQEEKEYKVEINENQNEMNILIDYIEKNMSSDQVKSMVQEFQSQNETVVFENTIHESKNQKSDADEIISNQITSENPQLTNSEQIIQDDLLKVYRAKYGLDESYGIDGLIEAIHGKFDAFLKDEEIKVTMKPAGIVQTKNIISDMCKNCQSKIEQLILMDKMLTYLQEQHKLRKYELDKEQYHSSHNQNSQEKDSKKKTSEELPNAVTEYLEQQVEANPPVERICYWESILQPDENGKYLDISDNDQMKQRVLDMKEHQLKRIEWLLSLSKNKSNECRTQGLIDYKKDLEKLNEFDLETLKKLARSGDLIEDWQENVIDFTKKEVEKEVKEGSDEKQKENDKELEKFFRKLVDHNVTMNGELKGVLVNGIEVKGIQSTGWGSSAKIEVDNATGTVKKIAERQLTKPDRAFIAHYLNYLEKQFKDLNDKDSKKEDKGEHPDMYN